MSRITCDVEYVDHGAENDHPKNSHPAHGGHGDELVGEGDAEAIGDSCSAQDGHNF